MRRAIVCLFFVGLSLACMADGDGEIPQFRDLPLGKTAKFKVTSHDCYSGMSRHWFDGSVRRTKSGWQIKCKTFEPSVEGVRKRRFSAVVADDIVKMFDDSLIPKVYGDDDIVLSGGHSIDVTWPGGGKIHAGGSGDDNRFYEAIKAAQECGIPKPVR